MMSIKEQIAILRRGIVDLVTEVELVKKLEKKRPLRIKYGADPSAPDIHLGHTVPLNKLRQFQELGHHVIFIIGDFTAMIGDPSGRSDTRKPLTRAAVEANAKTYQHQIFKILDPKKTEVVYNSSWFAKMSFEDIIIKMASKYTVARMLERDDFAKRYKTGSPISITEFLYPLIQGYDSVVVKSDVEIGGTDQTFNLLVGRDLQREEGQEPQVVLTLPLLEGTDGVQKMSKSLGNTIGITEDPEQIFGKVMSISDEGMFKYFQFLTSESLEEIKNQHPMEAKKKLAFQLVERFHGKPSAEKALAHFEKVFSRREVPEEMQPFSPALPRMPAWKFLVDAACAPSHSEANRLIKGGAFKLNSKAITDPDLEVHLKDGDIAKVGKRQFRKISLKK